MCAGYRACDSAPCQNGATCFEPSDGRNYWCTCAGPWTGANCDGRRAILTIDVILYQCMRPFTCNTAPSIYSFTVSSNVGAYRGTVAATRRNSVEFHWWKVKVTMLKDRKKGQRSTFGSAPAPVEPAEQICWSFFGGIPPVKWRHLANRSCTSGAIRRIDRALVAPLPLTDSSRTSTVQKSCVIF